MGRKRDHKWRWRLLAGLVLVALVAGGWAYWQSLNWRPDRAQFPVQGALIGQGDGEVDFAALYATGADFVYLEASQGGEGRDPSFAARLAVLSGGELRFGAVHAYDPCVPAERQSANFVTIVPRDMDLLPTAIALDKLASECDDPVVEAGLESELTTFINQVETHMGVPVVLKVSPQFEAAYAISTRIERNLWLTRDWVQPDYAGRPWALWTANSNLHSSLADAPLRWTVVQP